MNNFYFLIIITILADKCNGFRMKCNKVKFEQNLFSLKGKESRLTALNKEGKKKIGSET